MLLFVVTHFTIITITNNCIYYDVHVDFNVYVKMANDIQFIVNDIVFNKLVHL